MLTADFSTRDDLALVPSIAELGPSSAEVAILPAPGLALDGTLKLLRRPGSAAFAYNLPFHYAFGEANPVPGAGTTTLLDFGFARLRGDATTQLVLTQDSAGVFTFGVSDALLDGWGLGSAASRVDATATTGGMLEYSLVPPASGLTVGALRLKPLSMADTVSQLSWHVPTGAFAVDIPPSAVNSTAGFWPDGALTLADGHVIDTTADFEVRFPLPPDVAGFVAGDGDLDDNYLVIERRDSAVGFRARMKQDVLFGDFTARFAATGGTLSGSLAGTARVPFTDIELGAVTLSYEAGRLFEFEARRAFAAGNYSLGFGTGGAKCCVLLCVGDEPLDDCDDALCTVVDFP